MLTHKMSFYLCLGIASISYNTAAHAIELIETKENSVKGFLFTNIQNASAGPVFLTISGQPTIELQENSGKLFPCNQIQGKTISFGKKPGASDISRNMECGHSYILKEDAK